MSKRKNFYKGNWVCKCPEMWLMAYDVKVCDICFARNKYSKVNERRGKWLRKKV